MSKWKLIAVATALAAGVLVAVNSSPVSAGSDACEDVPFLAQGASASPGSITITATANTANQGPGSNYYLHQPRDMSWTGLPALDTTLTFSPGITQLVVRTSFHDDGWTGSGGKENYRFLATGPSGFVDLFNILDVDGRFEYTFDDPVTTLKIEYSPSRGVYGSFLQMYLPQGCDTDPVPDPTSATVIAPSGWMLFGEVSPPPLTPRAVETDDPSTDVTISSAPECDIYRQEDFDLSDLPAPETLSSTTEVGTYFVYCTGATVDAPYVIEYYELGEFRVIEELSDLEEPENTPNFYYELPSLSGESALEAEALPDTGTSVNFALIVASWVMIGAGVLVRRRRPSEIN